jgi:hypothetical protein
MARNPSKPQSALTTWGDTPEPELDLAQADAQLSRLWLEQIESPIRFESRFLTAEMTSKLVDLAARGASLPDRFSVLFTQADPPLELLEYAKRLAKGVRHRPDSPAEKVATVLYYCAIAAALVRCGRRITELDGGALEFGINWVLEQRWIDTPTRRLFNDASAYLKSHPSESVS